MRLLVAADRLWLDARASYLRRRRCRQVGHVWRPDSTDPPCCGQCGRRMPAPPLNALLDPLREALAPIDEARQAADTAHYGPARYAALTTRQSYVQRGLMAATGPEMVDEIQRRLSGDD